MNFINLDRQQLQIKLSLDNYLQQALQSCSFIGGIEISKLENKLSELTGSKYCIATSSGTDGILASMLALDVKPGDEIITPSFSYVAVSEMAQLLGAKLIFAEVNSETFLMDIDDAISKITPSTKAIIPVSLYGQIHNSEEIERLINVCNKNSIHLIEDAAQSFGACNKTYNSCNFADISITSFFPSKPLGCYGDGGAIFTNSDELDNRLRKIINHGQPKKYTHEILGFNARLDTIQAAILLAKLEVFESEVERRNEIARLYNKQIINQKIIHPFISDDNTSVWAQYTLKVDGRNELINLLKSKNIPSAIHYPRCIHQQNAYFQDVNLMISEDLASKVLSIPIDPYLNSEELELIINTLNAYE